MFRGGRSQHQGGSSRPRSKPKFNRQLRCVIKGETTTFLVTISQNQDVSELKETIHQKCNLECSTRDLVVIQVDIDLSGYTPDSLAGLTIEGNPLKDWSAISTVWEDQPPTTDRLHLVVTFKSTSARLLHLNIVPVDGDVLQSTLTIEVHPSTRMAMIHGQIRNKLRNILIGEFYRSNLEILPMQEMPAIDQLKKQNCADLRRRAQQLDQFPDVCVNDFFHMPERSGGTHFLVWLPPNNERSPPDPLLGVNYFIVLYFREFLSFEDATAASHSDCDSLLQFESLLKTEYHQSDQEDLFDMATGQYFPHAEVVASHIFLYKWRRRISYYTPFKNIHDVRNGILLYKPVEWAFKRAKMCIEVNNAGMMTFRLLDHDIFDVKLVDMAQELRCKFGDSDQPIRVEEDFETTFGDLDGQEVQFPVRSTTRPSKRLLSLHAVAAWIEAQCRTRNFDIPVPECNASESDMEKPKLALIEAWRTGREGGLYS